MFDRLRSAVKLLTKDEARRIAANIAASASSFRFCALACSSLGVEFVDLVQTGAEQDFQPYVGNIGNIKCTGKI